MASDLETIDLSQVGSPDWSRFCVLTPYSTNETAEDTLGFEWNAEENTTIQSRDDITVLPLVGDREVETYLSYPRGKGDFSSDTGPLCVARDRAKFVREQNEGSVRFSVAE